MSANAAELAPACRGFEKTAATRLTAVSAPGYGIHFAGRTEFLHFSADGSRLHVGFGRKHGATGVACWRVADGREVSRIATAANPIAMSPDRTRVASAGHTTVTVQSLDDGEIVAELRGSAETAVFSDDGRRLHCAARQTVTAWDLETKKQLRRNKIEVRSNFTAKRIAVSHDEKVNCVSYWDARRTAVVFYVTDTDNFRTYERTVPNALAMHPTRDLLAVGGYDQISITMIEASTATILGQVESDAPFNALAWSPDGDVLAGGSFQRVEIFDGETWKKSREIGGFHGPVTAVAISRDRVLAAACDDRALRLFDLNRSGAEIVVEPDAGGHRGAIRWLGFDANGRLHSGSEPARERRSGDAADINDELVDGAAIASPVHIAWDATTLGVAEVLATGTAAIVPPRGLTGEGKAKGAGSAKSTAKVYHSPNGRHWASLDAHSTIKLCLLSAEQPIAHWTLATADDVATALVFAPDGGALFVGTARGVILRFALEEPGA